MPSREEEQRGATERSNVCVTGITSPPTLGAAEEQGQDVEARASVLQLSKPWSGRQDFRLSCRALPFTHFQALLILLYSESLPLRHASSTELATS